MDKGSLRVNIELRDLYCSNTGLTTNEYFDMIDDWDKINTEMKQFEKLFLTRFRDVPRLDRVYSLLCFRMKKFEEDYRIRHCYSIHDAINSYVPPPESI